MIAQGLLAITLLLPQSKVALFDSVAVSSQVAGQDSWLSPDKAKHFLLAGFIEGASFAALEAVGMSRHSSFSGAIAVTGALSLMREVHDKRAKNQFSFRDLAWDLAGGLAAFVMLRHTERP